MGTVQISPNQYKESQKSFLTVSDLSWYKKKKKKRNFVVVVVVFLLHISLISCFH